LVVLLFILSASGCANLSGTAFAGQERGAAVILSSLAGEGLGPSPGAAWIGDEKDFLLVMNKINRQRIGGSPATLPAIDYDREGVLAIWMGRRPTGGYKIELASDKVSVKDGAAIVKVRWIEPSEKAVLTQAITSPCIMIKLTRAGFNRIQAVDQNGILRAETTLKTQKN